MVERTLLAVGLALLLTACGGSTPAPATPVSPQEAIARAGDVTVRATVLPTASLSSAMATQYGIAQADDTALLLVAVRRGPDGTDEPVPARIEATVSDLRGGTQPVAMREIRGAPGVLDYVGTVRFDAPDTLRFDVRATHSGGATTSMQFTRDFAPR